MLQVCLSIEVLGLHVANTLILRALHYKHVSREKTVLINFDEISNLDLAPAHIFKSLLPATESLCDRIIFQRIFTVSYIVFISVLAHRCKNDENEWREHCRFPI